MAMVTAFFLTFSASGPAGSAGLATMVRLATEAGGPIPIGVASPVYGSPPQALTTARALLSSLTVRPPGGPAYQETAYDYPAMGDDGCNTREHVLIASAGGPTMAGPCTVATAQWISQWDRVVTGDQALLDVAHTVPLEEAWLSGAWAWTPEQRRDFANDLVGNISLYVTTKDTNVERGSADPARWWPPHDGVHCKYATEWVWIKARWNLSVDEAEYTALMTQLNEAETNMCRDKPSNVPPLGLTPGVGPAAIVGRIFAPSGTPYSPVSVQAYSANHAIVKQTQVRVEGTYELTGLPAGTYTVKFLGGTSGTTDQWYSEWGPGGFPKPITVAAGGIASGIDVGMIVAPSFTDIRADNQFYGEIAWLFSTGITEGYPDGTYRPLTGIKRDAMAAFLYRLAGNPAVPADAPTFPDVPAGSQFYDEIRWLASTGITRGFPDGGFHPADNVNRDAMAAFLYRFDGSPNISLAPSVFSDVPAGSQFAAEISWLAAERITTGYPDGSFGAHREVNRDAMAAFMTRYAASVAIPSTP
jgi:hypothetical protein